MNSLTKPQKIRLVSILAELDAIWTPVRYSVDDSRESTKAGVAIFERRDRLHTNGIPLVIGGDERSRQAGHRELRGLVSRGLVRLLGYGKNRGVLLTAEGESIARSMAPVRRMDEAWKWLLAVADTQRHIVDPIPGANEFVMETQVVGIDGTAKGTVILDGTDPLSVLEDDCLPLFAAGLLDAHSDGEGRLGYAVTDKGRKAIAKGKPAKPRRLPPYDSSIGQVYIERYAAAMDSRERWGPSHGNTVVIPLGCGDWPEVRPAGKPKTVRSTKKK